MNHKSITPSERRSKGYILDQSIYTTFQNRQNHGERNQMSVARGCGERKGIDDREEGESGGMEEILS